MSFFNVGNPFSTPVGQKIEQATDGALPSENWALNMEICDIINSSADGPKDAVKAIRKRLTVSAGKNYTIVMYTLIVLETCVKNCGRAFHVLVCSKEFISELVKLIGPKNDPPTIVQEKVLSLIQCWADAFQSQPDLSGVGQIYTELRQKGVEFPMTDLDMMAPIFTPQRSVPDGVDHSIVGSPQRAAPVSPARGDSAVPVAQVTLSDSQTNKLRADLSVVEGNMAVMSDMLNELTAVPHGAHHDTDIELLNEALGLHFAWLQVVIRPKVEAHFTRNPQPTVALAILPLNELADTLKAMQGRIAELVGRLAGESPLTGALLQANDTLNNLLLRHSRFLNNRNAATGGSTPSAILGAAMGVPNAAPAKPEDESLIDLSDDVPDVSKLSVRDAKPANDEFDMFVHERNTNTGGSSYADNVEEQPSISLATAASQRALQGQPMPTGMDQREIDEIAAWLEQEKANSENGAQESVTSRDFDQFLAERAAAADTLPAAAADTLPAAADRHTPQHTPRHRQIKKEDPDSMFAL